MMDKSASRSKQKGAILLTVVVLFLLTLPLLIAIFVNHNLAGTMQGVATNSRSLAADAGTAQLATLRQLLDASLQNGLLEYQSSPPSWFINQNNSKINVQSSKFWNTCANNNLCQTATRQMSVGSGGNLTFNIEQLVTPTSIVDPTSCPPYDGSTMAVFYTIYIHAQAANSPADGGYTLQSMYRTCQKSQ